MQVKACSTYPWWAELTNSPMCGSADTIILHVNETWVFWSTPERARVDSNHLLDLPHSCVCIFWPYTISPKELHVEMCCVCLEHRADCKHGLPFYRRWSILIEAPPIKTTARRVANRL